MGETYLDKAYHLATEDETRAMYDAWAASYDTEIAENGYATPGRLADLLFKHMPDASEPILDYGCGTGLSGLALKLAGFEVIDGMDPSPEMLDGARRKGVYRDVKVLDLNIETPIPQGAYRIVTCVGVIGTGAAPASTFDLVMNALPKGGVVALSLNDHALADPQYTAALNGWLDCGAAQLHVKDYGPHLPGQNLSSNIYIIEKT